MKKLLILMSLLLSCTAPLRAQDFPGKDVSPEAVMDCVLARDTIKELNDDAINLSGGIVNKEMSKAAQATIWMYLEINRQYYTKYVEWVDAHCKDI